MRIAGQEITPQLFCGCGSGYRFGEAEEKTRASERPLAANESLKHLGDGLGNEEDNSDVGAITQGSPGIFRIS